MQIAPKKYAGFNRDAPEAQKYGKKVKNEDFDDDDDDDFIALSRQFGSFQKRKMLMNWVAVRALELILCRLRAMLQGYLVG